MPRRSIPPRALQSEWSLFARDIESAIVPTCRDLGIGLVPYSPLGRGLLTGAITSIDGLADSDFRRHVQPRFSPGNLDHNLGLVAEVRAVADRYGATPAQVALAWVLAQGDDVAPIPGTRRRRYLDGNLGALDVTLDEEDLARLGALEATGDRYADMSAINGETREAAG